MLMKRFCEWILVVIVIYGFVITINTVWASSYSNCPIKIGDRIPEFRLCDQNGGSVTDKDLAGKIVVMNFIFTRCGAPTMCPESTRKMRELSDLVKKELLQKEVWFITISFDPGHDTPEVLGQYARGFNIDLSNYSFLTGDAEVIKRLTRLFGVYTISEKGTINHTAKTVIIDKAGRMIYESSKVNWEPKVLLGVIKKTLKV